MDTLELLSFRTKLAFEYDSAVIESFKDIVSAVRNHPKLNYLVIFSSSGNTTKDQTLEDARDAAQVLLHKRIMVQFRKHVVFDSRVPDTIPSYKVLNEWS